MKLETWYRNKQTPLAFDEKVSICFFVGEKGCYLFKMKRKQWVKIYLIEEKNALSNKNKRSVRLAQSLPE